MSERNWQEDWERVERHRHAKTLFNDPSYMQSTFKERTDETEILAYWLQEIKSLREQLAHANCEWQREKSMRYSAIAREQQEKRQADEAEAREQKLKMLIEDLINSDVDEKWKASAARYLQKVYGDAA